jgi:hypothetical protein
MLSLRKSRCKGRYRNEAQPALVVSRLFTAAFDTAFAIAQR